jgi:hypothetical protein
MCTAIVGDPGHRQIIQNTVHREAVRLRQPRHLLPIHLPNLRLAKPRVVVHITKAARRQAARCLMRQATVREAAQAPVHGVVEVQVAAAADGAAVAAVVLAAAADLAGAEEEDNLTFIYKRLVPDDSDKPFFYVRQRDGYGDNERLIPWSVWIEISAPHLNFMV